MKIIDYTLITLAVALSGYAMVLMYELHQSNKKLEEATACAAIGMVSVGDGFCAELPVTK